MDAEAYQALPSAFAEDVLGLKLGDWQIDMLDSLLPLKSAVAGRTANGAGKTTVIIAGAALWHCAAFPRSKTIITSGSWTQIETQLIPALRRFSGRMSGWKFTQNEIVSPTGSFIRLFSTNNANMAEGHHEDADDPIAGPLMIIADEAKGVAQDNFQAFDRCSWTRYLLASSTGLSFGTFFDAFHKHSAAFRTFHIPASKCPWIDRHRIERVIAKWGRDHPFVKSTIDAEFMTDDGLAIYAIRLDDVQRNLLNPPTFDPVGRTCYWLDFAAGGDENVLGKREGNRISIMRAWREKDTFRAAAEFVTMLRSDKAKPEMVYGDGSGTGINFFNDMAAMGFDVPDSHRIKNNESAKDKSTYADRGAELWFEGGLAIRSGQFILPPNDEELVIQLSTRQVKPHSKGLMDLETKKDMKSRGLCSPDRAEAVTSLLTLQGPPESDPRFVDWRRQPQASRSEKFPTLAF